MSDFAGQGRVLDLTEDQRCIFTVSQARNKLTYCNSFCNIIINFSETPGDFSNKDVVIVTKFTAILLQAAEKRLYYQKSNFSFVYGICPTLKPHLLLHHFRVHIYFRLTYLR